MHGHTTRIVCTTYISTYTDCNAGDESFELQELKPFLHVPCVSLDSGMPGSFQASVTVAAENDDASQMAFDAFVNFSDEDELTSVKGGGGGGGESVVWDDQVVGETLPEAEQPEVEQAEVEQAEVEQAEVEQAEVEQLRAIIQDTTIQHRVVAVLTHEYKI